MSERLGIELDMEFNPRNRRPNPNSTSLLSRFRLRLLNISGRAKAIAVRARRDMFILKPSRATIHPVTVVPIFAPRITPIAWINSIKPAFTKLTTITVVADDD